MASSRTAILPRSHLRQRVPMFTSTAPAPTTACVQRQHLPRRRGAAEHRRSAAALGLPAHWSLHNGLNRARSMGPSSRQCSTRAVRSSPERAAHWLSERSAAAAPMISRRRQIARSRCAPTSMAWSSHRSSSTSASSIRERAAAPSIASCPELGSHIAAAPKAATTTAAHAVLVYQRADIGDELRSAFYRLNAQRDADVKSPTSGRSMIEACKLGGGLNSQPAGSLPSPHATRRSVEVDPGAASCSANTGFRMKYP